MVNTYSTVAQETFEASDTSLDQTLQLLVVARNDTSVEANIDPALAFGGFDLDVEVLYSCCRRDSVQRHVDHCGNATKRSSAGSSPESLPLSPTRLVEVNMCIHQTWK
jgi:hypothetical protein